MCIRDRHYVNSCGTGGVYYDVLNSRVSFLCWYYRTGGRANLCFVFLSTSSGSPFLPLFFSLFLAFLYVARFLPLNQIPGFVRVRIFPLVFYAALFMIGWWDGCSIAKTLCWWKDLAFSGEFVVEALVLPICSLLLKFVSKLRFWFCLRICVLVINSFLQDCSDEPAFTGW